MNPLTFFGVFVVSIASVKCYSETSNLTEDGCNHFRRLHGTTYAWSCDKILACPKQHAELILKQHTLSELSCGSDKICCPKTMLIGSARAKRAVDFSPMNPALTPYDYSRLQLNTAGSAEISRFTNTVTNIKSWTTHSPLRVNFNNNRYSTVVSTINVPVTRAPQNVYVDCKTFDSAHLSNNFTWNCQKGPCKPEPQSYFVKRDYPCNRNDDSQICCPDFLKEIPPANTGSNNAHPLFKGQFDSPTRSKTTEKTPEEPSLPEMPVIFPTRPESKFANTIRPYPPTNFVQPMTTDGPALREHGEKRFTKFDHDLLSILLKDNPRKNVVVSPASVKVLLALLAEGSTGSTSDEILSALQLKKTPEGQQSTPSLRKLQSTFQGGDGTSINLKSQSRIYVAYDVNVRKEYEDSIQTYYNADVKKLDFSKSEQAAKIINEWVNDATRGLIPTLVEKDNFNLDMKLYLLNYVYLKAKWDTEFDPSLTRPGCFYSSNNQCEKVKLMSLKRMLNYTYSQAHQAEIFEIPFKDPRYRTVFVLPYEGVDVYQVLQNLNRPDLFQIFDKFEETDVTLQMPRTTVELSTNLVQTLQQLNIRTVFGPAANLDGMLTNNRARFSVNDIVHKARLEFNEEGATGAAVSGGGIQVLSLDLDQRIIVNRPYLFFIRDTTVTDGFLFEGVVYSPDKVDA